MNVRSVLALLKWPLALAVLGGVCALVYFVHGEMQEERAREAGGDKIQSPRRAKDGVVDIEDEMAERYGLEEAPAQAVPWSERVPVYGRVIPNPRATAEVHSPFPGTLRAAAANAWPAPGQWVQGGQVLGWVDVRVGPQDRLTLQNTLNDARHKYQGALEVVKLRQEQVDRLKRLSSSDSIPQNELDTALVALADARTQEAATSASVGLYEGALTKLDQPADSRESIWRQPLPAPADGEVTQLAGRPGAAVEAGGLVAQLVDFRQALVRLDVPPQLLAAGPPPRVDLFAIPANPLALRGALNQPEGAQPAPAVEATLEGPAPQVDTASQFAGYWYGVKAVPSEEAAKHPGPGAAGGSRPSAVWRPGLQVKAYVQSPDSKPQDAVAVPAAAVLYHQGRALVYVRTEPDKYERREVRLLGRQGDRWVLTPRQGSAPVGVAPGETVVTGQAQVLLSEEFRGDVGNDD